MKTEVRGDGTSQQWDLEHIGNWSGWTVNGSVQTREHNVANELTRISGVWVDPVHDAAGNMTSAGKAGNEDTRLHYAWDAWNRMTEMRKDKKGKPGALLAKYVYDGETKRLSKETYRANGDLTGRSDYFYGTTWQVLDEVAYDPVTTASTVMAYCYDARYLDAVLCRKRGDEVLYYTHDSHFNVTALVNANGKVVERYVYSPYGEVTYLRGNWNPRTKSGYDNTILFSGYRLDQETGNYQVRYRYYHPTMGRWLSKDPVEEKGGWNVYEMCGNNDINCMDVLGLDRLTLYYDTRSEDELKQSSTHLPKGTRRIDTIGKILKDARKEVGDIYDAEGRCGNCIEKLIITAHGVKGDVSKSQYGTIMIGGIGVDKSLVWWIQQKEKLESVDENVKQTEQWKNAMTAMTERINTHEDLVSLAKLMCGKGEVDFVACRDEDTETRVYLEEVFGKGVTVVLHKGGVAWVKGEVVQVKE